MSGPKSEPQSGLQSGPRSGNETLACSFCEKSEHQVRKLVAGGGGGYICDACVKIAARIVSESDGEARSAWSRIAARLRGMTNRLRRHGVARARA